jgi:hypothetical protein
VPDLQRVINCQPYRFGSGWGRLAGCCWGLRFMGRVGGEGGDRPVLTLPLATGRASRLAARQLPHTRFGRSGGALALLLIPPERHRPGAFVGTGAPRGSSYSLAGAL